MVIYKKRIFFLLIFFISCKSKSSFTLTSEDFSYPLDSLVTTKLFVYQNVFDTNQKTITEKCYIKSEGLLITQNFNNNVKYDSTVSILNGTKYSISKVYSFIHSKDNSRQIVKGEVLSFSNEVQDGLTVKSIKKTLFKISESETEIIEDREKFLRDTVCFFLNEEYPCRVYSLVSKYKLKSLLYKDFETEYTGYILYAKGVGLMEYFIEGNNGSSKWRLVKIIEKR